MNSDPETKKPASPRPATTDGAAPLPRTATWKQWEEGRAARRALSRKITDGKPLRRAAGNPRKDKVLRALNDGERGMPWEKLTAEWSRWEPRDIDEARRVTERGRGNQS